MPAFAYAGTAIFRNKDFKTAQISVVGRKQDTGIGRKSAENQFRSVQVPEQKIQRCLKKARVPGLEDEVIIRLRGKFPADRRTAHIITLDTTHHKMLEIRLPLTKVVVYVQAGDATFFCLLL